MTIPEPQRRPALKRFAAKIALAMTAAMCATIVSEGLARLFLPEWAPRTARVTKFWQYHDVLGWAHRPGTTGTFSSHGFDVHVRVNSSGFRGPEHDVDDGGPQKRVVVLGDSFVWGFGVQEEQMFTSRLDALLPDVRVYNLGVSGYSTDQELLLYDRERAKYSPDLLVLVVANNDWALNLLPMAYGVYGKPVFAVDERELRLTNVPVPRAHWLKRSLVTMGRHSYILTQLHRTTYRFGLDRLLGAQRPVEQQDARMHDQDSRSFPHSAEQRLTMRLIEEICSMAFDAGTQALVVFADRVDSATDASEYLSERGIRSLLVDQWLSEVTGPVHLPDGVHWTPVGHDVVARGLASEVRASLR